MSDAETYAALANANDDREWAEHDELIIDEVSIPIRSIQRTDTSRFEGKLTFGDYSIDSDQLLSTWAQTNWVGGMNIANHAEGATDASFRYARAWTMSHRQLTLPLASKAVTLTFSSSLQNVADQTAAAILQINTGGASGTGLPYKMWLWNDEATIPLGSRFEMIYAACGDNLSAVNGATLTASSIGQLAAIPVNEGAWYSTSDPALLWIPLGSNGIQTYNPTNDTIGTVDTDIDAVAVKVWDKKLFALTVQNRLRVYDLTGNWDAGTNDDLLLPYEEIPRNLVEFYDRSGNPSLAIVTTHQVWIYDPDAEVIVPLGMRYPFSRQAGRASAMWRDDGLYVSHGLGVNRLSQGGVRTAMGLDRQEGYQVAAITDEYSGATWPQNPAIWSMVGAENFLVAGVSGFKDGTTSHEHDIVAWNTAGWHHIASLHTTDDEFFVPGHMIVADGLDTYQIVVGQRLPGATDSTTTTPKLHIIKIPQDFHAPLANVLDQDLLFEPQGVFYTGWFDAAMHNFYKAWSHFEVYLRDPEDGTTSPVGDVKVYYRTEQDVDTWTLLGTADDFGRNILKFGVTDDVSYGTISLKIELKLVITHEEGASASPQPDSPVIEGISLKFIKLAQEGSAWQAIVPLSDFNDWRGNGPTDIDEFLSKLSAEGSSKGPFSRMIHKIAADGTSATYRIRVAQWQRAELPGIAPLGDGVLNIIEVPVVDITGA